MAAGLSLPKENVEKFRTFLNEHTTLTEEDFIPKITIDVPMPIGYVIEHLIEELSVLEATVRLPSDVRRILCKALCILTFLQTWNRPRSNVRSL